MSEVINPNVDRLAQARTVQVYHNQGSSTLTPIQTDAATWGQLQEDMRAQGLGYNPNTQIATENKRFTTLVMPEATLPTEDFILAINVRDTKGGNITGAFRLVYDPNGELTEAQIMEIHRIATAVREAIVRAGGSAGNPELAKARDFYSRVKTTIQPQEPEPEPYDEEEEEW